MHRMLSQNENLCVETDTFRKVWNDTITCTVMP